MAQDAAFRLIFLILKANFGHEKRNSAKIYNAVLFIISYPGTFKRRIRIVVRAAYKERFVVSCKQKAALDQWNKENIHVDGVLDDDKITDDSSEPYYLYDSQ